LDYTNLWDPACSGVTATRISHIRYITVIVIIIIIDIIIIIIIIIGIIIVAGNLNRTLVGRPLMEVS
jgi:uncharacterized SAM-binding protein YcdF (DUF218 family)